MPEEIKCECRHVNPPGTEICESCGKPFNENSDGSLNMRYEGAARRSQTHNKTIIDQIWNFFSSVKVAVWLIVITLIASIVGTIFPQETFIPANVNPYDYYQAEYGKLGYLYVVFGLHNLYSSWWYISLLTMIGISLVICSIDRVIPLYRALKRQRVTRHEGFLKRQRIFGQAPHPQPDTVLQEAKAALQASGYRVREEAGAVMGEKGRFSRWGPYVNHIGLILFLIGILIGILPGFLIESFVWVRDGQTVNVPGTNYYVKSEGFFLETYEDGDFPQLDQVLEEDSMIPKEFRTDAVLYERILNDQTGEEEMVEVKRHSIIVNDPLVYKRLKLFQYEYRLNEFSEFTFTVTDRESGDILGEVVIDLADPERFYELSQGVQVELREYYPDFELDQNNKPTTASPIPNNPSFIFIVTSPEQPAGERVWIFLGKTIEDPEVENLYAFQLSDVKLNSVTGLLVRKNVNTPILIAGGIVVMIGLVMGFYWQHRRIWVQQMQDGQVWIAAHTNKNWFGIQKEVEKVIDQTGLEIDKETLDKEANA